MLGDVCWLEKVANKAKSTQQIQKILLHTLYLQFHRIMVKYNDLKVMADFNNNNQKW